MKLDKDVKRMSKAERGRELQRLRRLIRTHMKRKGNEGCWLADVDLYNQTLPEGAGKAGQMDLPIDELLANCRRYIICQKRHLGCERSGT